MYFLSNYIRFKKELKKYDASKALFDQKPVPPNTEEAHECGALQHYDRESEKFHEWHRLILTDYYKGRAQELFVEMPDLSEEGNYQKVDYDSDPHEPKYLTDSGLRKVKAAIREELKHRREASGYWIAAIVGLIGSLTGLASVLK